MTSTPSTSSPRPWLTPGVAVERIVVPVMAESGHDRGIEVATAWASRWSLPVLLVAVDTTGSGEAEIHLTRTRERLGASSGFPVSSRVLNGADVAAAVAGVLTTGDLVVMSSAGSPSGLPGPSHAWSLVQAAAGRPVLLVGPNATAPTLDGPVVVGLDGSGLAEQALPAALALATALGTRLWLAQAVPSAAVAQAEHLREQGEQVSTSAYLRDTAAQVAAGAWDTLGHRVAGTTTGADSGERVGWELVQSDHPAEALAAFAGERRAAALVLSTHGQSGLRADVFGSTALEAVARSTAPVLVIRPDSGDEPALNA
ncbi:MAG: universal stress protein [Acidimicrobiia bacterium]|nr:universal stress protein [Acidimicrobiia bacterium]